MCPVRPPSPDPAEAEHLSHRPPPRTLVGDCDRPAHLAAAAVKCLDRSSRSSSRSPRLRVGFSSSSSPALRPVSVMPTMRVRMMSAALLAASGCYGSHGPAHNNPAWIPDFFLSFGTTRLRGRTTRGYGLPIIDVGNLHSRNALARACATIRKASLIAPASRRAKASATNSTPPPRPPLRASVCDHARLRPAAMGPAFRHSPADEVAIICRVL